jgi:hypothetical protein
MVRQNNVWASLTEEDLERFEQMSRQLGMTKKQLVEVAILQLMETRPDEVAVGLVLERETYRQLLARTNRSTKFLSGRGRGEG